nr:hypothetical protein [Alcaligenes faecalis]
MYVPAGPPNTMATVKPLTTMDKALARRSGGDNCTAVAAATDQKQA